MIIFEIKLFSEKYKCFWLGGNIAFPDTYVINVFPSSFRIDELNPRVSQLRTRYVSRLQTNAFNDFHETLN